MTEDRKEELKKILGYEGGEEKPIPVIHGRTRGPAQKQSYSKTDRRFQSSQKRSKVMGTGRLRTRLNWGFWVLAIGFVLFLIWLLFR